MAQHGVFVPEIVANADGRTQYHLVEYLTSHIHKANTRAAYARRLKDFFDWCDIQEIRDLSAVNSLQIGRYIEQMTGEYAASTVKQALGPSARPSTISRAPFPRFITTRQKLSVGHALLSAKAKPRP